MKFLVKAFILLLLLNTVLLFVHYRDSSIATAKNEQKNSYNQEIEVVHRSNELLVRHHFTNLPGNRLELRWPKASENRTCHVEEPTSCSRLNEETTAFVEGEERTQAISYTIPIKESSDGELFIQDVFTELHQVTPSSTVLHVIDEVEAEGLWVTGLQQVGNQTLNLVNYTLFSGTGPVSDLYWQREQLARQSNEYVTVYGADSLEGIERYEQLFKTLGPIHMSIIMSEQEKNITSARFIVTSAAQLHDRMKQVAINQFNNKYEHINVERFTAEVLTALLLDEEQEVDEEREELELSIAPKAVEDIKDSLTPTQVSRFLEKVVGAEELTSSESVDELIEEVVEYKTSFFSENSQLEEGYYPFLLEDPRKIIVLNGEPLSQYAIVQDDQTYYPITEIMEAFGYDTRSNNHSLCVESAERNYRFPFTRHFYVLNDRRINTKNLFVKQINNQFYFEEATMLRVFQINLITRDDEIHLMPISG